MRRFVLAILVLLASAPLAWAQAPVPPNAWHPFRGGTNCIQVADANGNFNCSPLATINPSTGVFNLQLGGPITTVLGSLVLAPQSQQSSLVSVGNDLVIAKSSTTTTAPTGPGVGGVTFRVRPSPRIPGYCQVVAIAGNAFGTQYEFPVAFVSPSYPFNTSGNNPSIYDFVVLDIPGGPGGC